VTVPRERFPDLEAVQIAYLRALADRIAAGTTTDGDEWVIDALEDALARKGRLPSAEAAWAAARAEAAAAANGKAPA
jgi:hypothetical protein